MEYRLLGKGDSVDYRSIRLESLKLYPDSFSAHYEEARQLPKLMFEASLEVEAEDRFVVGAFEDRSLVGILGFVDSNDRNLESTGTLIQMYVKREYQGKGIALALTNLSLQEALKLRRIRHVMLEVRRENVSAISLYSKAGFIEILSGEKEDLLTMGLDLLQKEDQGFQP